MKKTKSLVKNAADKDQVKKAKDKEESQREKELNDLRETLSTEYGARSIYRILDKCGVFRHSFTGNSETFFNEGRRDIGLRLMADIKEASPQNYIKMHSMYVGIKIRPEHMNFILGDHE